MSETRMEIWRKYRDEIYSENKLLSNIDNCSKEIENYTNKINAINKNILLNLQPHEIKLLQVNKISNSKLNILENLKKVSSCIDTEFLKSIEKDLSMWQTEVSKIKVVLDDNKVNPDWINANEGFLNYITIINELKKIEGKISKSIEEYNLPNVNDIKDEQLKKIKNEIDSASKIKEPIVFTSKDYQWAIYISIIIIIICIIVSAIIIACNF